MTHSSDQTLVKHFVKDSWKIWLAGLVFGVVVAIGVASSLKPHYEGSVSFSVSKKQSVTQDKANFYLYDGYYSGQAATGARSDLSAWVVSPVNVETVLRQSGVSVENVSVEKLTRMFKVSNADVVTAVLDVSYSSPKESEAKAIGENLVNLVKTQYTPTDVIVSPSNPLIVMVHANKLLIGIGIALAMTIVAFALSLVINYLRND